MIEKLEKVTENDVYIFDVVLCDNDVDRDGECLSDNSLDTLQQLFIGSTGMFEQNIKGSSQTLRITSTRVVVDDTKTTKFGKPYKFIQGNAYMVKTTSNQDLIEKIDGGIKKEVSISYSAKTHRCLICGADEYNKGCSHIRGEYYGRKLCYTIIDNITKLYEWSIVAVQNETEKR